MNDPLPRSVDRGDSCLIRAAHHVSLLRRPPPLSSPRKRRQPLQCPFGADKVSCKRHSVVMQLVPVWKVFTVRAFSRRVVEPCFLKAIFEMAKRIQVVAAACGLSCTIGTRRGEMVARRGGNDRVCRDFFFLTGETTDC